MVRSTLLEGVDHLTRLRGVVSAATLQQVEAYGFTKSQFTGYCSREAFAVENKIVYFRSSYQNATLVIGSKEESKEL